MCVLILFENSYIIHIDYLNQMCNQLIWTHICTLINGVGGERVLCSKVITAYTLIGWIFDLKVQ